MSIPAGIASGQSVRIREKGSHGGHNGIRNIIDQMGTDQFYRIKVGVGEKPSGWDLADYVLGKFNEEDLPAMDEGMDKAVKGVELMLSRGVAEAANRINQKPKTMKKQKAEAEKAEAKKNAKAALEALAGKIPGLLEIKVVAEGRLESSTADLMLDSTFESFDALKAYSKSETASP